MKKHAIFAAVTTAITLSMGTASAGVKMEKCYVVDKNGKGLIKEHKADCKSKNNSCAGHNAAGDASAWILVPEGKCAKINAGDFSDVDKEIQEKIEMSK